MQPHSFARGYQVIPVLYVKMNILSPLNHIGTLVKDQLTKNAKVSFWTLNSSPLIYMSSLMSVPHCLDYGSVVLSFKIRKVSNFVVFQDDLAFLSLLNYHRSFRINLSIFAKTATGILKGIVSNL